MQQDPVHPPVRRPGWRLGSLVWRAANGLSAPPFRGALFVVWGFFLSLFAYRVVFWIRLAASKTPPMGFVVSRFWPHEFVTASGWDALLALILSLPLALWAKSRPKSVFRFPYVAVSTLIGVVLLFLAAAHMRMLFDRGEPLGLAFFREATGGAMTLKEAWSYGKTVDKLLVLSPVVIFSVLVFSLRRLSERGWKRVALATLTLGFVFLTSTLLPEHRRFHNKIHHNPHFYAVGEVLKSYRRGPPQESLLSRPVSAAQRQSLALIDPQFIDPRPRLQRAPSVQMGAQPLNVVLVLMESTGSRYVLQNAPDQKPVMPYLKELKARSWWMERHYSTANSSHRSLFSIFSGLYPSFGSAFFCITPEVTLPTISSFLPAAYEKFLITPGELRSYFPRSLFERSGFTELAGKSEISLAHPRPGPANAYNEFDVHDRFLERIDQAKGPFFGVYYTFTPHFHYFDYGPKYHAFPPQADKPLSLYMNNLRVLDEVLSRTEAHLRRKGLWDNTVLVLVGDHGESFGQHEYFTHGNDSHEQALRTPFLLHFPGATPTLITSPTSHVDVLPTLLHLLGLPFEPQLFQGESLLNDEVRRRYVFAVGNEQSFVSVDDEGHKILQRFRKDVCEAFDLSKDPNEKSPLPCSAFAPQRQALSDFRPYQTKIVQAYSQSNRDGNARFFGKKHPHLHPFRIPHE